MKKLCLGLLVLLACACEASPAPVVPVVAPAPAVVEVAPAPRTGYVWVRGYWFWNGWRHVWVRGYWRPVLVR